MVLRFSRILKTPSWSDVLYGVLLLSAFAFGVWVRVLPVIGKDFPLNDGGLFYSMVQDLISNRFWLPTHTSYNGGQIPFAYPPFALYLTASLHLLGFDLLTLFRLVPVTFSILTLLPLWLLTRELRFDRISQVAVLFAFSALRFSFAWQIMGGGITRSLGLFCAVTAAYLTVGALRSGGYRIIICGLVAGAGITTHGEAAIFVLLSIGVLFILEPMTRFRVRRCAEIGAVAAVPTVAWLWVVLSQHGFAPFMAAHSSVTNIVSLQKVSTAPNYLVSFCVSLTQASFIPGIQYLIIASIAFMPARLRWLHLWWMCEIALDSRSGGAFATVPMAAVAGIGASGLLKGIKVNGGIVSTLAVLSVALWGIVPVTLAAIEENQQNPEFSTLYRGIRSDFEWIAKSTPPDATFLVLDDEFWWLASASEWFPALAKRRSIATVQGSEWISGSMKRTMSVFQRMRVCLDTAPNCILDPVRLHFYIYVTPSIVQSRAEFVRVLEESSGVSKLWEGYGRVYEVAARQK